MFKIYRKHENGQIVYLDCLDTPYSFLGLADELVVDSNFCICSEDRKQMWTVKTKGKEICHYDEVPSILKEDLEEDLLDADHQFEKEEAMKSVVKRFRELKALFPNAILVMKNKDNFYESFNTDAKFLAENGDFTCTNMLVNGEPTPMIGFPGYMLETAASAVMAKDEMFVVYESDEKVQTFQKLKTRKE